MKIGVDIRTLSFRKGGISQYTYNLLKNMACIDSRNTYYLFNYNKSQFEWDNFKGNMKEIVVRLPQRYNLKTFWENLLVPSVIRKYGIDVWFSPDFTIPRFLRIPTVVTIHDLIFKNFHDIEHNKASRQMASKVDYVIKSAYRIIVPSLYTREEVLKEYEVEDHKIVMIPEAAEERFHEIDDPDILSTVSSRYGIRFPYILFVGETSKRKNLFRLMKAYHLLKKEDRAGNRKLVIVGKRTIDTENIIREADRLGLAEDILFTGYVPNEDLPFIYNGADVFVFPSLYEGFGIPLLEAMQCGIPVVASQATSIPEVVGEGALLFNPNNVKEIAKRIDQVINKKIDVDALKEKGKRQAEKFRWENAALQTIGVFNRLA